MLFRFFLSLVLFSLSLYAATPQLYRAVGDPVYQEIPAVNRLLRVPYLKKHKTMFQDFLSQANQHKKLGFSYDKKRRDKTLSKQEQKSYLNTLRELDKTLRNIHTIVREAIAEIIQKNHTTSFYRLKNSGLSILYKDPKSARAIKVYTEQLNRKKHEAKAKKAAQDKAAKKAYYLFLRSNDNLNGTWKGKNSEKISLLLSFNADHLSMQYDEGKSQNIFTGTYSIQDNRFHFMIKKRKRIVDGNTHLRKVNLKREYQLKKVTETELILHYKDEVISLKRP